MTAVVRSGQRDEDVDALRAQIAELEATLGAREAEIAKARSDLGAFKIRYREQVGELHQELEELESAIAEAELGEMSKRLEGHAAGKSGAQAGAQAEPQARYTSDAARKLFRDVARAIHPDLARDELTRDRRHTLMIEANRAYALGDEERLRWILQAWERSPEAVLGSDPEAAHMRLARRLAQLREQLDVYANDLAALKESPLWKLKAMVDEAAARGKDLVADAVGRLKRDIMVARNRLDAMRSHP